MSFWSWFSSRVNLGPSCEDPSSSNSASIWSASATAELSVMAPILHGTMSHWRRGSEVAKVEGAQSLLALVRAVEEAAVDTAVGGAMPLVGALHSQNALGQRPAGHLHPAKAARLDHRLEFD